MFGSPGKPVVMSCNFKSVYAGTMTTPRDGLSRGLGSSSLVRSTFNVGAWPTSKFGGLAGLNGLGSLKIQPCLSRGSAGTWQDVQPIDANCCSPNSTASSISG